MTLALYDAAVQVVPVLMVALFLDRRAASDEAMLSTLWLRLQQRIYLVLCVGAFVVALLVLSGTVEANAMTDAVLLAALIGCIGLLAARAWLRLSHAAPRGQNRR